MQPLSVAFAIAAVASVGLKAAVVGSDVAIDGERLSTSVMTIARERGMTVRSERRFAGVAVVATKGACRMDILPLRPSGELDDLMERDFAHYPRVRYYFDGALSTDRPNVGPYVTFQAARALNRIGIARSWAPLLAIGDNGSCDDALARFDGIRTAFRPEVVPD